MQNDRPGLIDTHTGQTLKFSKRRDGWGCWVFTICWNFYLRIDVIIVMLVPQYILRVHPVYVSISPGVSFCIYSQNSHNPYLSVDSPGYGFSGVMGWKGWEKNKRSRKLMKIFEKILFSLLQWVCWTRRQTFNPIWASHCWCTSPQWCWLHDWAKIDLDCRLIPENLVINRSINLVLW